MSKKALSTKNALLIEAEEALEDAVQSLHNDFEPSNQSAVYKRVHAALTKLKAARYCPSSLNVFKL